MDTTELGYYPKGYRNIDELISEGIPDVERSGLIPEIKEKIDIILSYTPKWIKIGFPDMQGPFNIAHMCIGDDALKEIGTRRIILNIGQELPDGKEEEFIKKDLDRAKENPRLLFGYTGMHWKKRDEKEIIKLHLKLDEYWEKHIT